MRPVNVAMYRKPPSYTGDEIIGPNSIVQYSNGLDRGLVLREPVLLVLPRNIVHESLFLLDIPNLSLKKDWEICQFFNWKYTKVQ